MTPSEVLFIYKLAGAKIHQAGVSFGETKKPKNPEDAQHLLRTTVTALEDAVKAVRRLLE